MMRNVAGIITCNTRPETFKGMLSRRSIATLPFGGRYRLVDFVLSSMVNGGVRTVGILSPLRYNSLLDHLGAGKDWLLDRKGGGLFVLSSMGYDFKKNNLFLPLQDLCENRGFVQRFRGDAFVIAMADKVINIDLCEVFEHHERVGADVTMVYQPNPHTGSAVEGYQLVLSEEGLVTADYPDDSLNLSSAHFIGIMIINKKALLQILDEYGNTQRMDLLDTIVQNHNSLKVSGFCFEGYMRTIRSVSSYMAANMDLLNPAVRNELFLGERRIMTKVKDCAPTRYGEESVVKNSIISSGCVVEGEVENSVLAREVHIGKGSIVKNCVIMQQGQIADNVVIKNAILDKQVKINSQVILQGNEEDPIVINKNSIM